MGGAMSIVILGSTSGSITLQEPAVAGSTVLSLPATTGTVLTSASPASDLPSSIKGPAFSANQTSGQSISNSTFTKVTFNNETFDTNSNFASSTFTPTVAGYYQVNGNVGFVGSSNGFTMIAIYKNGSAVSQGSGIPNNTNIGGMATASTVVFCNGSTDYIELYAWQNSGGSLAMQSGAPVTFSACLVRLS